MELKVIRRNGNNSIFDIHKITDAIRKAFDACGRQYNEGMLNMISLRVTSDFEPKINDGSISVEDIQDSVEKVLSNAGYADVAKAYILYRKQRETIREAARTVLDYKNLMDGYLKTLDWRVKENSTVTYSLRGLILSNSGAITANYWLSEVYDKEISNLHRNCYMKRIISLTLLLLARKTCLFLSEIQDLIDRSCMYLLQRRRA